MTWRGLLAGALVALAACGVQIDEAPAPDAGTTTTQPGTANPFTGHAEDINGCTGPYDWSGAGIHIVSPGGCNIPAIVNLHGGGWLAGSASDMDVYQGPENFLGIAYVSVEYPLAPVPMSAMLTSVQLTINLLRSQHLLLGIDPNRIGVIGESAGGQLALQTGIDDGDLRFVGSMFGPTDMRAEWTNFCVTYAATAPGQQLCAAITAIEGGTPSTNPGAYDGTSPDITVANLATHQQAPYFYFGESTGDILVPPPTVSSFVSTLQAHGLSVVDDPVPPGGGGIGHNLSSDELNYLRYRVLIDASNAMNSPALPPPSFAPGGGGGGGGGGPPPPPPPPPPCAQSCSSTVGVLTFSWSASDATCAQAQADARNVVLAVMWNAIQQAGSPWTVWYPSPLSIPVTCG